MLKTNMFGTQKIKEIKATVEANSVKKQELYNKVSEKG